MNGGNGSNGGGAVKRPDGRTDESPIEHSKDYKEQKPAVTSSNGEPPRPQGKPFKIGGNPY